MISSHLSGALAFFTQAGQGADPLRSNCGFHVGDDQDKVRAERELLAESVGAPIVWMNQTHSTRVRIVRLAHESNGSSLHVDDSLLFDPRVVSADNHIDADGIIFDTRGTRVTGDAGTLRSPLAGKEDGEPASSITLPALAVMTADCLPLLFADTSGSVVAAVHAGRVGLENGILAETLRLYGSLGITMADIHMLIGPAICGKCYEVPEPMAEEAQRKLPGIRSTTTWGTPSLDLALAARTQASSLGIGSIDDSGICTLENPMFHSYRRDATCGRQASIIRPQGNAF